MLFYAPRRGAVLLTALMAVLAVMHVAPWSPSVLVPPPAYTTTGAHPAGLAALGTFFLQVGALTFGGGLTMIAFIQDHVVHQLHWLTPQEFLDGLALGQFTPGPILMVAAYVGYKVAGLAGAAVAASAIFLPSFILMLSVLPMFERVRTWVWTRAALKGVGPAVIGVMAVSLVQMAPHALPDPFAVAIFIGTLVAVMAWRIGMTWAVHITLAPTWFDPAETGGIITPYLCLYALHDALVKPMPDGQLSPCLATKWHESEDGLAYDFELRQGLKFHNGDPFTAEDVKFSFERYKGTGATELKQQVKAIEILNPHHVRFVLHAPWPDFFTFHRI